MGCVEEIHVTEGMKYILLLAILYFGANWASSAIVLTVNRTSGVLTASGSVTLLTSTSTVFSPSWLYTDGSTWRVPTAGAGSPMTPTTDIPFLHEINIDGGIQATLTGGGLAGSVSFLYNQTFYVGSNYFGFYSLIGDLYEYPILAEGAIMTMSGTALVEDLSRLDAVPNGTFVSSYNGQTTTLIVVTPEPSIALLYLLGIQGSLLLRKRSE